MGSFDNINHQKLVEKLHTYPAMKQVIQAWLKSGVLDGVELAKTEKGTPQGGPLSPLLMNVALHGMEIVVKEGYTSQRAEKPLVI